MNNTTAPQVPVFDGSAESGASRFCHVCGSTAFAHVDVLAQELISAWELTEDEAHYINVQQGTHCTGCNANVRSIALAKALLRFRRFEGTLKELVADSSQHDIRVLEVNEAGGLHPFLCLLPLHTLASYPEFDMTALRISSAVYDLVLHSDTLEHISDPLRGLRECRRVLAADGALIFTIPMVLARLTRSRVDRPPSFHGPPGCRDEAMRVHTEFGADAWTMIMDAGFSSCEIVPYAYPSGIALVAMK